MTLDNNKMMRLCGATWIYCDGNCSECEVTSITTSSTSDIDKDGSSYTNNT